MPSANRKIKIRISHPYTLRLSDSGALHWHGDHGDRADAQVPQRVRHDTGIAQPYQCDTSGPGQRRRKRSLRIPRVIRFSLIRDLYGPGQGYIEALDLRNSHLGRCVPSVCTQTRQQTEELIFEFAWQRIILMMLQRQNRVGCVSQYPIWLPPTIVNQF
jgi:hypothetical protein